MLRDVLIFRRTDKQVYRPMPSCTEGTWQSRTRPRSHWTWFVLRTDQTRIHFVHRLDPQITPCVPESPWKRCTVWSGASLPLPGTMGRRTTSTRLTNGTMQRAELELLHENRTIFCGRAPTQINLSSQTSARCVDACSCKAIVLVVLFCSTVVVRAAVTSANPR